MFFSFISVLTEIMIVTFLLGMLIFLFRPNRRCTPAQIRLKRILLRGALIVLAISFSYGLITIWFELHR